MTKRLGVLLGMLALTILFAVGVTFECSGCGAEPVTATDTGVEKIVPISPLPAEPGVLVPDLDVITPTIGVDAEEEQLAEDCRLGESSETSESDHLVHCRN